MSLYSQTVQPSRLRYLRGNLTSAEMAEKLNELIGFGGKYADEGKGLTLNNQSGAQTISHLENGRRLITPEIALAYAEIFNVSLDYIYGRTNHRNPEYANTEETLGLSDNAIRALLELKKEIIYKARLL